MQKFLLNLTRIIENNTRIYWSLIFGLAACLISFVVEAVHVQNLIAQLNTQDQNVMRAAIEPLSPYYRYVRWGIAVICILWSSLEYQKSKKRLGL